MPVFGPVRPVRSFMPLSALLLRLLAALTCAGVAVAQEEERDRIDLDAFEEAVEEGRDRVVLELGARRLVEDPSDVA
ncbi:MAG TPA: hypothetical protein VEI02_14870, partial [Planctomycetota bacterium]|nr:hypothetical protein [Planctomycetota bacterium]